MTKEKTALTQLIEEFTLIKTTKCKSLQEVMFFDGVLAIIEAKYLPIEKQQIVDAAKFNHPMNRCQIDGEQYYQNKFEQ